MRLEIRGGWKKERGLGTRGRPDMFIYDFLVLSNMVSFSSQTLLLRLCISSQARYKSGLLYTFFIISFVPVCVFF